MVRALLLLGLSLGVLGGDSLRADPGVPAEPASLREVVRIQAHAPWARCLDVSRDGRWAVSGGPDRAVVVWDTRTWREAARLVLPPGGG